MRPASTSSAEPTPSPMANAASFTSWQTIRPSTRPGASATHSCGGRASREEASAASVGGGGGAGEPGELHEASSSSGGRRWNPHGSASPRAARLRSAHSTDERRATAAASGVAGGDARRPPRASAARPRVGSKPRRDRAARAGPRPAARRPRSQRGSAVAPARLERLRVLRPVRPSSGTRSSRGPVFRPEPPGGHHPRLDRARLPARLAERELGERLAPPRSPRRRPPGPSARTGPIRKPPPRRQMRSICSWVATRSCSSRSASAPNGRPQRFTRKPGPSLARITVLPIASPVARATATARSPVWSARITSSSSISGGGLKKCMPDHVLGPRRRARERGHGDRRGVRGEHRVVAAHLRQPGEQLALQLEALGRRLDHQLAWRQALQRAGRPRAAPAASAASLPFSTQRSSPRRTRSTPALERLGHRIVEHHSHARRAAELGDAGAHRAGADHAERARRLGAHRPRNSGLRFSRNARMPSTRSSVAIASSNRRRSWSSPAPRVSRRPPAPPASPAGRRSAAAAPPRRPARARP